MATDRKKLEEAGKMLQQMSQQLEMLKRAVEAQVKMKAPQPSGLPPQPTTISALTSPSPKTATEVKTAEKEPTTLWEYYTQKGEKLPPISERAKIYEQLGLGSAGSYTGTAEQNIKLLQALLSKERTKPSEPSVVEPAPPPTTPAPTPEATDPLRQYRAQLENLIRAYERALATPPPQRGLTPEERAIYEQTTEELRKRYQKALEDLERKHQQEQQRLIARYAAAGFAEPGIVEGPMAGVPGIVTRALQELREAQARERAGLEQAQAGDILAVQQALAEAERRAREEEYQRWAKEQQRRLESLLKQAGLYETIYGLTAPKREIIGDRIYEYDPLTRTYKDVTPEEIKRAQIEGAWQTGIKDDIVYRFNPLTGEFQVIATLPTKDKVKQVIQDPGTGRYLIVRESGKIEDTGITGIPKTKISEGQAKLQSTLQIIKQVRTLLDRIGLADTPAAALIRGPQLEMEAKLKTNPDAAAYKSLVEGTLSFVIKSLGEAGTLSAQDVARARKLLPTFYDTKASAEQKLNELETLINSILATQTMMMGRAPNISTEDEWEWVP